MNNLDALFLIITIYLIYQGYQKGFIHSFRFFLSVIGGALMAYTFSESLLPSLSPSPIKSPTAARFLLFFIFFLLLNVAAHFAEKGLKKVMEKISLTYLDQGLGALFGAFKALALIFIFVSLAASYKIQPLREPIATSSFVKHSYLMARSMTGINLVEKFKETAQKIDLRP